MLKQKIKTKFDVESYLLENLEQLPILDSSIKEIKANKENNSDFKPDSLEEIGLLLKYDGFFLESDSDYYLYQYEGNQIKKYKLRDLATYLKESKGFDETLLDLTVRENNILIIVEELPKVRRIDLRLWNILLERDLTVKKAIREFKRYKES